MKNTRILCLSGSLRRSSYNTTLIKAISKLAPDEIDIVVFTEMGGLPLCNPDREEENISEVERLRNEIKEADGLIIASPEYAHGISSVLKNALDWLVSEETFPSMPVALFNTSPRATHAQIALREVITTMSGNIIESASASIPLLGSNLDVDGIINHSEISHILVQAINLFHNAIVEHNNSSLV